MLHVFVVLAVVLTFYGPTPAAAGYVSHDVKSPMAPPPGSVRWSTLGVVADGVTDNTVALSALPTGVLIAGDCPAGGTIRIDGTWLWRSNLELYQNPSCPIVCYINDPTVYCISQTDLTTPITNVQVTGLNIRKPDHTYAGRILRNWIDHFKLLHWIVPLHNGIAFLRGSDQEVAYGTATNSSPVVGAPGIRHIGNVPKVAASPGMAANVWIHDNVISSGDAVYQACQPLSTSLWINVSSDDILYENNYGVSSSSAPILVGENTLEAAFSNFSCTKIAYRDISGSGSNREILISTSFAPNVVADVSIKDSTFDLTAGSGAGAAEIRSDLGGSVARVVLDGVKLLHPYKRGLIFSGNVTDSSFVNGSIEQPRTGGLPTASILGTTRTTIANSTIAGLLGDAIVVGGSGLVTASPTISGNSMIGITDNRSGVDLVNTNGASVTNNTMTPASGNSKARGVTFTGAKSQNSGTINSTAKGNKVNGAPNSLKIVFVCGQGNKASYNAGSSDSAC